MARIIATLLILQIVASYGNYDEPLVDDTPRLSRAASGVTILIGLCRSVEYISNYYATSYCCDSIYDKDFPINELGNPETSKAYYCVLRDSRVSRKDCGKELLRVQMFAKCCVKSSAMRTGAFLEISGNEHYPEPPVSLHIGMTSSPFKDHPAKLTGICLVLISPSSTESATTSCCKGGIIETPRKSPFSEPPKMYCNLMNISSSQDNCDSRIQIIESFTKCCSEMATSLQTLTETLLEVRTRY